MTGIFKAEHLKMQHTFGGKLPVTAPVFTLCFVMLMASGTGNLLPAIAWNWWYTLLLPGMLAIICYLGVNKDKKINYYNMLIVPFSSGRCIAGKVIYYAAGLLMANIILCTGTLVFGLFFGTTIRITGSFAAVMLLCVTFLWEIPLYILLSLKSGLSGCIFVCMFLSFTDFLFANTKFWWAWPPSIPARLMCPVLGIMPNGIIAPPGSTLLNSNVILPGIIISSAWFILLYFLMVSWFKRKVVEG